MDKDKPIPKEWWDWYLSPPVDYRQLYGEPLPMDSLDRHYKALYELKQKEKNNA
jgi:hypothetical protein